jgi:hypothetical protein
MKRQAQWIQAAAIWIPIAGACVPSTAPLAASPVVYGAPIVITTGGHYSGAWESDDPSTPAVTVNTTQPVVIQNCYIRSAGEGISSYGQHAKLTVTGCQGEALNPNIAGMAKQAFVGVAIFNSATIEHNTETGYAFGVRALNYGADVTTTGQKLVVLYNIINNVDGRLSNGQGGYSNDPLGAGGNAVSLNTLRNAQIQIAWNQVIDTPGDSRPEDIISTYESSGTSAHPILIHDNYLQGGYAADPSAQVNYTGCGIQIGDAGNKDNVGYVQAYHNQVVNFENCGISISSGHDNQVYANRIISAPNAPNGVLLGGNNRSGINLWDYYWDPNLTCQPTADPYWYNNSAHGNTVDVVNRAGLAAGNIYCQLGATVTAYNNTNTLGHLATTADEQAEFSTWQQKVASHGITLGP